MFKLVFTLLLMGSIFEVPVAGLLSISIGDEPEMCGCKTPKPKCKKENEVYEICPAPCPFRTCGIDDRTVRCKDPLMPGDPNCPKSKCRCKSGFFRDANGNCVRWEECCTKCSGDNEIYDPCDAPCPARRCDFDPTVVKCGKPPQVGDDACLVGCRCKDGYLRNDKNVCIPADECPKKCNKNEVWDICPDCSPQTCETRNTVYECLLIPPGIPKPKCKPACRCQRGYFRNKIGECISKQECEKCRGEHEYWSCGSACDNVCGSKYDQENCNIVNKKCNPMCYCEKNYARATNGTCIPKEDCKYECPKNEEYNKCPDNMCRAKKCNDVGFPLNCTTNKPCPGKPGCVCKNGFLRNDKSVCVPTTDCPSCGGDKNATSGCGINCGRLCSNYDSKEPVICPRICRGNACDCRLGYVYDSNTKQCVLPCDCTPVCKDNEKYSQCANGVCKKNCADKYKPDVCEIPKECKGGCICADGYLRNKKGICVPSDKCDNCRDNEEYSECPDNLCIAKKCTDVGFPINCTVVFTTDIVLGPCPGKPGCVCKDGYLRDSNGVCIPTKDCPSCGGDKNAIPGCGNHCGKQCSDYQTPVPCPTNCYPNACDCRLGYVYDQNTKQCVEPYNCTPTCKQHEFYSPCANGVFRKNCTDQSEPDNCEHPDKCKGGCICEDGYLRNSKGDCVLVDQCDNCPDNEEYNDCPDNMCTAKKCTDVGFPLNCSTVEPCPGKPGCVCKQGYLRNYGGVCVPTTECPSCGGDKNATPGCGLNCNRLCSNYDKEPQPCILMCYPNACECREDYVYDSNTKQCVLPCDCTEVCQDNEEYSTCANGVCKKDCTDWNKPDKCPRPKRCRSGCVCAKGYLRNKKGVCVPIDQCEKCPVNEQYNECPDSLCIPKKCSDTGYPLNCTTRYPGDPCPGKPGCICADGYLRDCGGVCIPDKECPSCGGDKNATLGCGINCGRLCSNYNSPEPVICALGCIQNGCDCRENYVYDSNTKKCVLPRDCTVVCKANETYSTCVNGGCEKKLCSDLNKSDVCARPKICKDGCLCAKGYLRNKKGVCVKIEDCEKCGCH